MKYLFLLATALCVACTTESDARTYDNPDIGLSLTYPSSWVDLREAGVTGEPSGMSKEQLEQVLSETTLAIASLRSEGGLNRNTNLLVMALPASKDECAAVDSPEFARSEFEDYSAMFPGATEVAESHPQIATDIGGYTISIPLRDRTAMQHRYFYCTNGHYVIISTTSSTPAGEVELKQILASITVTRHEPRAE